MLDDRLDDVAIDEISPVRRQVQRLTVDKFPEAIGPECLFRVVETAFDGIKRRRLVALPDQIVSERVLHFRRDAEMGVNPLLPEASGVDSGYNLEFGDAATAAN